VVRKGLEAEHIMFPNLKVAGSTLSKVYTNQRRENSVPNKEAPRRVLVNVRERSAVKKGEFSRKESVGRKKGLTGAKWTKKLYLSETWE